MHILLIHQYAGNKGDRAVLNALCRGLLAVFPDCTIGVSTSDPQSWSDKFSFNKGNISFVPDAWDYEACPPKSIYWSAVRKFRNYTFTILREALLANIHGFSRFLCNPTFLTELKKADLVISVGGHHFTTLLSTDLVSAINFTAMCVLDARKTLIPFSQSFGPFQFHNNRNLAITKKILEWCKNLYYRESSSENALLQLGVKNSKVHYIPETVLFLNTLFPERKTIQNRKKQIGIAIYCAQKRSPDRETQYIETFSEFVSFANKSGYDVVFFPMEIKGTPPDDRIMIQKIIATAGNPEQCSFIDNDLTTEEHLQKVMDCQIFIGHKTHSTIFALLTGTPLIGIAYHPKTRDFMRQFNVEDFCIDDEKLTVECLKEKFQSIVPDLETISSSTFSQARKMSDVILDTLKQLN